MCTKAFYHRLMNPHHSLSLLSRVTVVLAAGIILATFVVKDIASERFRKTMESLESVSNMHLMQANYLRIQYLVVSVGKSADLTLAILENGGKEITNNSSQAINISLQTVRNYATVVNEYNKSVVQLVNELPEGNENRLIASVLIKKCDKLLSDIDSLSLVIHNEHETVNRGDYAGMLDIFAMRLRTILESSDKLEWAVINDLALQKAIVEQKYDFNVRLSYILFTFGWVVGLIGQLLKKG